MTQQLLFKLPKPKSERQKKRRPGAYVDKDKADLRYYYHEHLSKEFILDSRENAVTTTYSSFEAIPRGKQRWYIRQLMKLGYQIHYNLFSADAVAAMTKEKPDRKK